MFLQLKNCLTVLILSLFASGLCHATNFGDISITIVSAPSAESYHGYAEWSFMITNTAPKKSHRVTLVMPEQTYSYGDHLKSISRSVTVGPSTSAKMSMFQPAVGMNGSRISVYIDGRRQERSFTQSFGFHASRSSYYSRGGTAPVCVLLGRNVSYNDFSKGTSIKSPGSSMARYSGSGIQASYERSEMALSQWSTDWLGYSRYDGVVLTGTDMERMPVAVKSAIYDYVQCGGTLLVLGDWQDSAAWRGNTKVSGPFNVNHKGFGICIIDDDETKQWDQTKWDTLRNSIWAQTATPFMYNVSVKKANDHFPVVSELKIPAKGLLLLVVVFAIAIGPANLYILSKMKRRIWLLWTVPAISVVGSIAVFAYAMLAEGWTGIRKSESVTILNEADHKAATIGVCAFYSPLTPKGGLLFDYGTEVSALGIQQGSRGGRSRTLELTNGQKFARGWVSARIPAHFLIRKSETRRERVKLSIDQSGEISAVNGLGGNITTLWYMDADGMVFKGSDIPAGARAQLSALGSEGNGKQEDLRKVYSVRNWPGSFLANDARSYLRRNTYVAEVKKSLFIEQALQNVKSDDSRSIVIGVLKGDLDAGAGS